MARTARASVGGIVYHVLNRGNGRAAVFHKADDYHAFLGLLQPACERLPMRILALCLMPNHFHLVLWPHHDGDLSRWMQWLMTSHVRRYHRHYHGSGHVWQGRFKAFPIQQDGHLVTAIRYVERNARRANLVQHAEAWPYSSLHGWSQRRPASWLSDWPIDRPRSWVRYVNEPETGAELEAMQRSIGRGRPLGSDAWTRRTAQQLGIESTIRPRGRPRKQVEK